MRRELICLMGAASILAACNGRKEAPAEAVAPAQAATPTAPAELPMPEVPGVITAPADRAAWLGEHFWDAMDFADRKLSLDTAFMEQSFANFLSIFPMMETAVARQRAMAALVDHAAVDSAASQRLVEIAEKYLGDPNSPMRDEGLMIDFYEQATAHGAVTPTECGRMAYALEQASKNRPGMLAADFTYVTPGGECRRLSDRRGRGAMTLLIFYDPDCPTCHDIMAELAAKELPAGVGVLAIDAEADRERWEATVGSLPEAWEAGFALTPVVDEELYVLPALPVMYLLDDDGRVVLKDPRPEAIFNFEF